MWKRFHTGEPLGSGDFDQWRRRQIGTRRRHQVRAAHHLRRRRSRRRLARDRLPLHERQRLRRRPRRAPASRPPSASSTTSRASRPGRSAAGGSGLVVLGVRHLANPRWTEMALAMETDLREHGLSLVLLSIGTERERELAALEQMRRLRAEGVAIAMAHAEPGDFERLRRAGIKVVTLAGYVADPTLDAIFPDRPRGVEVAVEHLVGARAPPDRRLRQHRQPAGDGDPRRGPPGGPASLRPGSRSEPGVRRRAGDDGRGRRGGAAASATPAPRPSSPSATSWRSASGWRWSGSASTSRPTSRSSAWTTSSWPAPSAAA